MLTPASKGEANREIGGPGEAQSKRRLPIFAAFTHGFFCLVLGLWPVLGYASFQAVTGEKADRWLITVVGMLLAGIGSSMLIAAIRRDIAFEVFTIGIITALSLAVTDFIFVIERSIPAVYLLDAVAETLFVTLWVFAIRDQRRPRRPAASQLPPPGAANLIEPGGPDGPK